MTMVILDISRLISRVRHSTPSGVDRVEMAYARGLLGLYGEDLAFAAVHPTGRYGRIDQRTALDYLDELERRWNNTDDKVARLSLIGQLHWMLRLLPGKPPRNSKERAVYVQVSPHHLTDQAKVRRILAAENARLLCMIHDLIPIEYPEYARPSGAALHRQRMDTIGALAAAVIFNSVATSQSFRPWIEGSDRKPRTYVALLGVEPIVAATEQHVSERPYFVCLGTIEPRKNHLLLLNLWRHFADQLPAAEIPRLLVIGRRGWENEQVLDMLDRCPALRDHVEEVSSCSDQQLAKLLRGARTLVMPSFAEGFGIPVAEALSVGVPVICSDIPALHEVGRNVPDYADPLDGLHWKALILDHSAKGPAWQAQIDRIPDWQTPTWEAHLQIAARAITDLV